MMSERLTNFRKRAFNVLAVVLCAFVLIAVNRDLLANYVPAWLEYRVEKSTESLEVETKQIDGAAGFVVGQVTAETKETLTDVLVLATPLFGDEPQYQVRPSEDGSYRLKLPKGVFDIEIHCRGYSTARKSIKVAEDEDVEFTHEFAEDSQLITDWFSTLVPADDQPKLAVFGMLGLSLAFLGFPMFKRAKSSVVTQMFDFVLVGGAIVTFGYVLVQSEDLFQRYWVEGLMIGERAADERPFELILGAIGVVLILEATRRCIGLTLPTLCLVFFAFAYFGPDLPDWLFQHRGNDWEDLSRGFLQSGTMSVFGIAMNVMFKYVFLFVLFGTLLDQTGATSYIINFARSLFRNSAGGPAKVAVVSSGLMGSLSGSAVANTATTGSFTIPLMKSTGFDADTAAGVEAAASSGGALMPPIMGAGAYMMLDILSGTEPDITLISILKSALIPALLYYFALLLSVHFHSKKIGAGAEQSAATSDLDESTRYQGFVFFGSFIILIAMLLANFTPFLSVGVGLVGIVVLAAFRSETRIGPKKLYDAMVSAGKSGTALIVAAACVGLILAVVDMTGLGPSLPAKVQSLAGNSAILALVLLMVSTIILGMGLPSAVCYLLVALTVRQVLVPIDGNPPVLDTPPLAAHLFIFYFGMMSMVTPPVALAAYAGAAIADGNIIKSAFQAFRFALVGFALPYAFVFKPELLMLTQGNEPASVLMITIVVGLTIVAIIGLAASVAGYAFRPIGWFVRVVLLVCSMSIFLLRLDGMQTWVQIGAVVAIGVLLGMNFLLRSSKPL